ncbi:conserved hypothetical protein [Verticillium alfalfae VaMs.102]|uniref:C2H2-type domain-containing protein n=1 Tax=Verticillium alfalfae (strain VaMs.102 / ATCC MYA-4576 / FGSC 10136) TaxID=526221 RepID=C9SID4_VERA1|nr:conserved hypothetical protein [Verticillium alfalfae VaMs.102]EEY18707.1 conserved hypothetical protein [Verticillium alfalfae VaMs.102]
MDDSYGIDMEDFTASEQLNFEMFTELDPTPSFTQASESHNHFYHGSGTSHDDTCIDPNASFMFSSRLDNDALISQPSAPPPRSAPSAAAAATATAAAAAAASRPRPRQSSMPTETNSNANNDFDFHGFQWTNAAAASFNTLSDPNYDLLPSATDEAAASPRDACAAECTKPDCEDICEDPDCEVDSEACADDCAVDCESACDDEECQKAECPDECDEEACNPVTRCTEDHCSDKAEAAPDDASAAAAKILEDLQNPPIVRQQRRQPQHPQYMQLQQQHRQQQHLQLQQMQQQLQSQQQEQYLYTHNMNFASQQTLQSPALQSSQIPSSRPEDGMTFSQMDLSSVSFEQAAPQVDMMGRFIDTMPLNPTIDPFFEHIYQCHDPNQPQCVEPCVLSTFPTQYAQCPFPQWPQDHLDQNAFYQGDHSPTTQNTKCNTKFRTASQLVAHFNEQHRPALAATNHTFAIPQYNMHHPSPAPVTQTIKGLTFRRGTGHLNGSPTLMQRPLSAMTASSTLTGDSAQISTPVTPASESFCRASNQCRWFTHGQVCGLTFRDEADLHQHVRDHHTAPLNKEVGGFPCHWENCIRVTKCNAGHFSQSPSLTAIYRSTPAQCTQGTHTGLKPLACNICGRTFSESSNLSKHRRTHNLKGDHVCDICGKDFRRLDQLRRHIKTKHKTDDGSGMAMAKADSDQSGLDLTFQSSPQFDALDAMLQGLPKLENSPL